MGPPRRWFPFPSCLIPYLMLLQVVARRHFWELQLGRWLLLRLDRGALCLGHVVLFRWRRCFFWR